MFEEPDSLIVPYTEIVEASVETFGGFFNKRKFFVLRREPANAPAEQICITPGEDGMPRIIMILRFLYEQPQLFWKALSKEAEDGNLVMQMQKDFDSLYPDGATERQRKEFIEALSAKVADHINAKGVPANLLHARTLTQLEHFRGVSLDLDQGFDGAAWARGK